MEQTSLFFEFCFFLGSILETHWSLWLWSWDLLNFATVRVPLRLPIVSPGVRTPTRTQLNGATQHHTRWLDTNAKTNYLEPPAAQSCWVSGSATRIWCEEVIGEVDWFLTWEVPPLLYSISAPLECILSNQNACIMSNLQHNIQKLFFIVSALRSATYLMERERYYTHTQPELTTVPLMIGHWIRW